MAQFTKALSKDDRYILILDVSETGTSVANNTSTISYSLKVKKKSGTGYYTSNTNNPYKVTINNEEEENDSKAYDFRNSTPKTITLASGTTIVEHDDDGKKTIAVSGYFKDANNGLGSATASGSLVLTNLNRGVIPTFSANPATLGEEITITHTRPESSLGIGYYFVMKAYVNGVLKASLTSYNDSTNWTPSLSWASYYPNELSGSCTFTCETHKVVALLQTDEIIGTQSVNLGFIIPSSVQPSVSIGTPVETNATMISKNWGVFVEGKSQVKIPITATGIYNSTISSVYTSVNGINVPGNYDADNDVWNFTTNSNTTGTNTISSSAIDSRTNTGTDTDTFNVVPYSNPSISNAEIQRCLSDGTIDNNGTYVKYSFNGTSSSILDGNNQELNTTTWKLSYKKTTDANYTDVTLGTGNTYNTTIGGDVSSFTISTDYTYDIKISGTDAFTTTEYHAELDTGFDLMNFNPSGKSMAIGKVSEATALEEKLEVGLTTEFLEPITATTIDATTITGTTINFTNSNYHDSSKQDTLSVTTGTDAVSRTSGATIRTSDYQKYGKIVQMRLVCDTTSSTSAGSNCFEGTLDSSLLPSDYVTGASFNGSTAQIAQISPEGEVIVRNLVSTLNSGTAFGIHFIWIIN